MSLKSGDRARAHKQANKRRARRHEIQATKRSLTSKAEGSEASKATPAEPTA